MDDLVLNKKENVLWGTVLLLSMFAYFIDSYYLLILFFWVFTFLCVGNAKRIYAENERALITFIRRSMYILPLMVPFLIIWDFSFTILSIWWYLLGFILGLLFIIPKISVWRLVLSNDYIQLTLSGNKFQHMMNIYTFIGGAISEELFFRYFVLNKQNSILILIINVLISSYLFMLSHYATKWSNNFSQPDFVIQIVFGVFSSFLFLFSGSIIPSIIAHLTYNSTHVIQSIKSICIINRDSKD
ncbi:CPBP family intramembrane metalloprotease [Lysinibacillus sphaericus]|uniref:CPBP family intramembrane metalloprotease n=1 Tax=Lysinibacillus sphaericus TaxID=1421 RepID=A0A544UII2_LYSSH|nr:CPBP family intramembrane glutamic endopeptidase [Lysinibacillus sp. SDF0037]TQR32832.1 CPBP family intramembrane metalloprotease [Lysinibacillus sp. SDF0037]